MSILDRVLKALIAVPASLTGALVLTLTMCAMTVHKPAYAADNYPVRPVKIIVPYPAGGAVDPPARILAQQLSAQTGQQFVVENRPGAGGNIGVDAVVGAAPDGYTLLFSGPNVTIAPALMKETTRFNPKTSFTPIAQIVTVPTVVAVPAQSPFKSIADLVAGAKKSPDKISYASPGNGSPSHLAMELLKFKTGADIQHIPYKGTAPALVDVLGGQVGVIVSTLAGPIEHIRSGRLRGLGVTSTERAAELPEVPTIAETVSGFKLVTWLGLLGPRNMPPEVTAKLEAEISVAMKNPATIRRLRDAGTTPEFLGSIGMARHLESEADLYARLITDAKLKAD